MSVILKCPACRQKMQVALYFQGSSVTCASCERELDVPCCLYDDADRADENAAMDEAEFLENLPTERERRYDVRITSNVTRRPSGAVPSPCAEVALPRARRAAVLILLVIVALIGMLLIWSTLHDPSAAASRIAGG